MSLLIHRYTITPEQGKRERERITLILLCADCDAPFFNELKINRFL
jgi:hypothetical protein